MTKDYSKMVEQEFLTAKQLFFTCISVIICIQIIPFMITPTPYMEWLLLGFTAAVSTCAVVGAILVQHNADKMAETYKNVFNTDFYATIGLFTQIREIVLQEAADKNRNVEEELDDVIPKAYAFFRAYLDKENVEPPSLEELGITPVEESGETNEGELFV
ncbi:MAG: hypothetical protein HOC18_02315 [Candidatus Marinimicrobia bacterium]|jgi:hypothetical protein|nr:hypothetical protein [Candidatus Neomarinimicrobiota bacterium]